MARITANFRPTAELYNHGWTVNSKCFDGDMSTYGNAPAGIDKYAAMLLDLSGIPAGSVIKEVTYRYTLYRTDSAGYCRLKGAMGYSESGDGSAGEHQVTAWQEIPLTAYQTKETTSTPQTVTAAESAQILSTGYPTLYVYIQNAHRVYEISVDITYEPPEPKIFVGATRASKVYVGTAQASAVYLGTEKIL